MTPLETAAVTFVRAQQYYDAICQTGFPDEVINEANDKLLQAWHALEAAVEAAAPLQPPLDSQPVEHVE